MGREGSFVRQSLRGLSRFIRLAKVLAQGTRAPSGLASCRPKRMFDVAMIEVDSNAEKGVGCSPARGSWTMVPF
jgi:hypothetical protein